MLTREEVIEIARECGEKVVDCDLFGKPLSNIDVMFIGAYGPFAERFAQAIYRRGVEDAAQRCIDACCYGWSDDDVVRHIRNLMEE